MEQVKTLVACLKEGHEKAFDYLDKRVNEIGNIEIKDIKDTLYPTGSTLGQNASGYIERIVIYKENNEEGRKGEPWKPTLDTDFQEFIDAAHPSHDARVLMEEVYTQGKKTIREVIAMPYGWFRDFGTPKKWEEMKKVLNKYGFKLYKKGNVIKN